MNRDNLHTLLKGNQPKAAVMVASALIALTSLLSACGGGSEATPTPAAIPTQVPTTAASNSGTTSEATATTEAGGATATTTANGALTETEQAAQTAGISAGVVNSGTANVSVITSTQLITGTQVVTNVEVSTNTAVIEQHLITQVITNTAVVSNVVQNTQTSNATASSVTTQTAVLTPESATGSAAATNVTVTPNATPAVVVSNTIQVPATATPQAGQGQTTGGTAPVAASKVFTGMTDAADKSILASNLLNSKFQTSDGKVTGKLDDMVVDVQSGQLLYLILSYGGLLDVGETKVAVPSNAMSLKSDGEFLLNIPPEDLKNFPKLGDDWPQAGSPNWDNDVRAFWQKEGFPVTFDSSLAGTRIRRTDQWTGAPLKDSGLGEGTVQDEIISLGQGTVPYVLVSFANAPAVAAGGNNAPAATATPLAGNVVTGTTAGDNNWYAVPLTAFDPQNPDLALRSNVNAATFEGAPRFNRDALGANPFLPTNYDKDWVVFWKKLTTPNP